MPPVPTPTSHFFTSLRTRLHYLDWGNPSAPLLILVHGGFDHARSWDWTARALAQESDIYFMDEPFAGVDAATETAIIALLHELREKGKTLLVVHHDLPTARNYFDQLLLLNMRVVAYGETEKVFTYELLQKTYGGRLTILSEVADAVGQRAK